MWEMNGSKIKGYFEMILDVINPACHRSTSKDKFKKSIATVLTLICKGQPFL
jgi:hypothetical protein